MAITLASVFSKGGSVLISNVTMELSGFGGGGWLVFSFVIWVFTGITESIFSFQVHFICAAVPIFCVLHGYVYAHC